MMYGWSILQCFPVVKADTPSAETDTVVRPSTPRRYAEEAGFQRVEVLEIEKTSSSGSIGSRCEMRAA